MPVVSPPHCCSSHFQVPALLSTQLHHCGWSLHHSLQMHWLCVWFKPLGASRHLARFPNMTEKHPWMWSLPAFLMVLHLECYAVVRSSSSVSPHLLGWFILLPVLPPVPLPRKTPLPVSPGWLLLVFQDSAQVWFPLGRPPGAQDSSSGLSKTLHVCVLHLIFTWSVYLPGNCFWVCSKGQV